MIKSLKRKYNLFLAKKAFKNILINKKTIFFFPYYHIGGGEMVHLDIIKLFNKKDTVCIITETSINNALKESFENHTNLFELNNYNLSHKYKQKFGKIVANLANKENIKTVFGCNTLEFYSCISHLNPIIKTIDLFHAFSFENKESLEKITLNKLDYIDQRIVLGQKTKNDFKKLYIKNNIDLKYLDKITIIKNKVSSSTVTEPKPKNKLLKILFIGRDSEEKRPKLFLDIINSCFEKGIDIEATLIGDFNRLKKEYSSNKIKFIGEIKDKNLINNYYHKSDLIVITSTREGLPMVILEGMAHGVVPISTNVGEIPEIITKNTGLLVNENQNINQLISNFVNHINYLNSNRKELYTLQENVVTVVNQNYNEEKFNNNYKTIIT